ncbi:MAG: hypothetical protein ACRD1Q_18195 [Vicinamibacterales bacterium]
MTRLLDALERLDSLRQKTGSTHGREDDTLSPPPKRRAPNPTESRPPRPRVPGTPTHLDLTDDTADDDLRAGSEFNAIDFEPDAPEAPRNKVGPGARIRTQTSAPASRVSARQTTQGEEPAQKAKADPRLPHAQDDALRLALQIRAAVRKAQTNTLMVCGVEPGQTVRRLTRELALAFVQLREAPLLIVDLEPSVATEATYEFHPLPETDSSSWIDPDSRGRPSAAVLCPPKRQHGRRRGFVNADQFSRNLENLRAQAALVICCAPAVPDSVATLTAGSCCGATVLVVPGRGSTNEAVVAARDLCTRSGMTLLGCVIDHTPADPTVADQ